MGQFLHALFGYNSQPEVTTLLVWGGYVLVVLTLFLRPVAPAPQRAVAAPDTSAAS